MHVVDRLDDRIAIVLLVQSVEEHDAEHPLSKRARFDELREKRRQTHQDEHQDHSFPLDGLEYVQHQREGILVAFRMVREVLGFVVGENEPASSHRVQMCPHQLKHSLELVGYKARRSTVYRRHGVKVECALDATLLRQIAHAHLLFAADDKGRGHDGQVRQQAYRQPLFADARGLRKVRANPPPTLLDGLRFESVQEHGLADPPQACEDQILQDKVLLQQAQEFPGLLSTPRQIGGHVAGSRPKRVAKRGRRH